MVRATRGTDLRDVRGHLFSIGDAQPARRGLATTPPGLGIQIAKQTVRNRGRARSDPGGWNDQRHRKLPAQQRSAPFFIQELVQGTFDEASDDHLRSNAVRQLIEDEILTMLQDKKTAMLERVVAQLTSAAGGDQQRAQTAAEAGLMEVERLLCNHSESL